jgi:eukaryotic-like serine/threonine-protein kinase
VLKPYTRAEVSFEQRKEIGHEGSNSRVHIAYDPNLDTELVVKTIPKAKLDVGMYFLESRLLYKSSHPNVVPILYACEDLDSIYLAMPFFERGSLNAVISAEFLTIREVIRYAVHFLAGLHNVHSKGLVHFDVKPDNILLTERDEALLADFGLTKQTNNLGIAEQDRMYLKMLPPEYFRKEHFNNRFDIYQVGVTLYRLVNGNALFYEQFNSYGDSSSFDRDQFKFDVINERFPNRERYLEHVPARFKKVIAKCLKSAPAERFKSATEIISELAAIGGADLDWRYTVNSEGVRIWNKLRDDRTLRLTVDASGHSVAEKKCGEGPFRRIAAHCGANISTSEIKQFLRSDGK